LPNCPHCNAEVDVDQKVCAWCGEPVRAASRPKALPSGPTHQPPPRVSAPVSAPSQPTPTTAKKGPSAVDARELAKRGDLDGAQRLYREILSNHPNDPEALFGTGGIHFKRGEHKKAVETWLKLKVLNPSYPNLDQWIANAKKNLSPSGLSTPPSPPPRPQTPSTSQRVPIPPTSSRAPEEDWQRQSVRIDHLDEEALKEPPPAPKFKKEKGKTEPVEEEDESLDNAPPDWLAQAGWGLVVLYIALIWGIYYL